MNHSSMFSSILLLHSLVRWLVLLSLLFSVYRGWKGWREKKDFTRVDNSYRYWTVFFALSQLLLGLWLYFISPIVQYFLHDIKATIHERDARFFGLEHIVVMTLSVLAIVIGSEKIRKKSTSPEKFRTMFIWFTIGLLLILSSIPWPFSPFTSRPFFRMY